MFMKKHILYLLEIAEDGHYLYIPKIKLFQLYFAIIIEEFFILCFFHGFYIIIGMPILVFWGYYTSYLFDIWKKFKLRMSILIFPIITVGIAGWIFGPFIAKFLGKLLGILFIKS